MTPTVALCLAFVAGAFLFGTKTGHAVARATVGLAVVLLAIVGAVALLAR